MRTRLLRALVNPQRWQFEWRYWRGRPPWDTSVTPPEVLEFLEGAPPGRALDLGCGTGTNAITLARRGWQVTGVDFAPRAIRAARRKAARSGLEIDFRVADVVSLNLLEGSYDYALDIGCLHSLNERNWERYAGGVARLVRPDGRYMLYAWLPRQWRRGKRGLTPRHVADLFGPTFEVTRTAIGEEQGSGSAWYWMTRKA